MMDNSNSPCQDKPVPNIPIDLQQLPQWVLWKNVTRDDKLTKLPFQTNGTLAKSNDASTWTAFHSCLQHAEQYTGVGFVFSEADPFVGIDLDGCRDPDTGEIADWADEIISRFDSYSEISPSKTGVKIFIRAEWNESGKKCLVDVEPVCEKQPGIEVYAKLRYFATTGMIVKSVSDKVEQRDDQLSWLFDKHFPQPTPPRPRHRDSKHKESFTSVMQRAAKYVAQIPPAISGQRGHDVTFHVACVLALGFELDEAEAMSVIRDWNASCEPPWSEIELLHKVQSAAEQPGERGYLLRDETGEDDCGSTDSEKSDSSKSKPSQASQLVELAQEAEMFHDPSGEPFARFPVRDHFEVSRLSNRTFKRWLARMFYQTTNRTPSAQAMQDALSVLEGKAIFDGNERPVFVRCAEHDGRIYIDLGDKDWRVIEVDQRGWRIVDDSPVVFRRAKAMLPLPIPDPNGDIGALRHFVNIHDGEWPLLVAWLVAAIRPIGPYPVLAVHGEHGSAKSTLCRYMRRIVDPNMSPLRADYREPRDLMICANSGWVIALDNLSRIPAWLSDCFCRLATGGGFSTRTLFQNDEETIFDAKRPLLLNCIDEVVTRADLLDRCLLLNLPRIHSKRRVKEATLDAQFETAVPGIFGGLLTAISLAIREEENVVLDSLPRLADFATWATAAEPALGLKPGEFMLSYTSSRESGNDSAIESSPIGKPLLDFVATVNTWSGTSTDLLRELEGRIDERTRKLKNWPGTARSLGGAVKRLAPNLRDVGVGVDFGRTGRRRTITLERMDGEFCVTNVTNVTTPEKQATECDDIVTQDRPGDANGFQNVTTTKPVFPEKNGAGDANDDGDAKNTAHSKYEITSANALLTEAAGDETEEFEL